MTESLPEDYGRNCLNCNELESDCDCEMFYEETDMIEDIDRTINSIIEDLLNTRKMLKKIKDPVAEQIDDQLGQVLVYFNTDYYGGIMQKLIRLEDRIK